MMGEYYFIGGLGEFETFRAIPGAFLQKVL